MNTYNPTYDYISAHLYYASTHPNFTPKGIPIVGTYYDLLVEQYKIETFTDTPLDVIRARKNKLAYISYKLDLQWIEERKKIETSLIEPTEDETKISFVTIGFNHQEFNIKACLQLIKTILNNLSIVLDGSYAVFENFRANGEHPHAHFKIYHNKKTTKSTIVQTFYRAKKAKKYITNSNFIDVKPFMDYHNLYLDGQKAPHKMPFVEKDIEWREKNNIPHKIHKDN